MLRPSLRSSLLLALTLLAATAGCRSTTWRGHFTPTLAETLVGPMESDGSGSPVARVLLAVRGAERRGGSRSAPFEMCIRLRIENRSDEPLDVLLADFLLVDANLDPFGAARVDSPEGAGDELSVPAGLTVLLDVRFEFPGGLEPEELDLNGLNLRGALRSGPDAYVLGVTFTRGPRVIYFDPWYRHDPFYGPPYYGPYYGPWIGPGSGYGYGYGYRW